MSVLAPPLLMRGTISGGEVSHLSLVDGKTRVHTVFEIVQEVYSPRALLNQEELWCRPLLGERALIKKAQFFKGVEFNGPPI